MGLIAPRCIAPRPPPLGAISDDIWQNQEHNAEASDFVIYQHEWQLNTPMLNLGGKDHIKQIAMRLQEGSDFPVVVERSMTSPREGTMYEYPVHPHPGLDMDRRQIVVQALTAMGVHDAENRVVVAPAFAEGLSSVEASDAYHQSIDTRGGFGCLGGLGGLGGFF